MNSGALVKVDTRESWMERALGARGARLLLVAGGTVAVTLAIPTTLIESLSTASGLSEMTKYFMPPIGIGSRVLLGGLLALVPTGVVWVLWGSPAPRESAPGYEAEYLEIEDDDDMMHAHRQSSAPASGLGWNALIRLVRGGFHEDADTLSRRRRDRHPDAPPRPPLFASRDLPPHDDQPAISSAPASEPFAADPALTVPPPYVPSFAEAVARATPVSATPPAEEILMPRAPAPLSDEEIAQAVAAIPPRETVAPAPAAAYAPAEKPSGTAGLDLPLIEGADLAALAARFERGVAKREVIAHAQDAQHQLHNSMGFPQSDSALRGPLRGQRPMELVSASAADETDADGLLRVDADVERALNSALTTLRKLTEQGRRRR